MTGQVGGHDGREGSGMTWKQRLQQAPRRRYSARDIAARLGVEVVLVIDSLTRLGEFIDSPAKRTIEEPVLKRVCSDLGLEYEVPPVAPVSAWERRGISDRSSKKAEASRSSTPGRTASVGPRDRSVGLGNPADDASPAMEEVAWVLYDFSATERDAWLAVLRRGQARDAARYRDAGFAPEDLLVELSGWTVAKRLRAGESLAEVKRLLDRQRRAS